MKYVLDSPAWKRCRAFLVDHADGREVGRVYVAFPADGAGRVSVEVWDYAKSYPNARTVRTASGYGYDKVTAALSGQSIDGITLADHCHQDDETRKLLAEMPTGFDECTEFDGRIRREHGCTVSNWSQELNRYTSVYRLPGLEQLNAMGYRVRQIG